MQHRVQQNPEPCSEKPAVFETSIDGEGDGYFSCAGTVKLESVRSVICDIQVNESIARNVCCDVDLKSTYKYFEWRQS